MHHTRSNTWLWTKPSIQRSSVKSTCGKIPHLPSWPSYKKHNSTPSKATVHSMRRYSWCTSTCRQIWSSKSWIEDSDRRGSLRRKLRLSYNRGLRAYHICMSLAPLQKDSIHPRSFWPHNAQSSSTTHGWAWAVLSRIQLTLQVRKTVKIKTVQRSSQSQLRITPLHKKYSTWMTWLRSIMSGCLNCSRSEWSF